MAAARKDIPNMNRTAIPAIRPERMFLRASLRSMRVDPSSLRGWRWRGVGGGQLDLRRRRPRTLELDVSHHGAEQQRQVGHREQVQAQGGATVGAPEEKDRTGDEQ